MSGELLLALDAGTGSCRAVLFAVDGTQVGMAQRDAVPSATRPVLGGSVEQVPAVRCEGAASPSAG